MIKLTITPYDTLFFGSGKPFNIGDVAKSLALPLPHTLAGAISEVVRRETGKTPFIKAIFGPFLEYKEKDRWEIYFPSPANILTGRKGEKGIYRSDPLGDLNLVKVENTNIEGVDELFFYRGEREVEGFRGFISLEGLKNHLKGEPPNTKSVKSLDNFVEYEGRVGISIRPEVGTTGERGLYRIWFARFKKEVRLVAWVEFGEREGYATSEESSEIIKNSGIMKLGGENRMVRYESEEKDFTEFIRKELELEEKPNCEDGCNVLFLTPGVCGGWNPFGHVRAAAVPGYIPAGINLQHRAIKHTIRRAIPPGSIFYGVKLPSVDRNPGFVMKDGNAVKVVGEYDGFVPYIGGGLVLIWKDKNGGGK